VRTIAQRFEELHRETEGLAGDGHRWAAEMMRLRQGTGKINGERKLLWNLIVCAEKVNTLERLPRPFVSLPRLSSARGNTQ